jgi:hypothetical protein
MVDPDRSVNCYFCGDEFDERDGQSADQFNGGDGGSVCEHCQESQPWRTKPLSDPDAEYLMKIIREFATETKLEAVRAGEPSILTARRDALQELLVRIAESPPDSYYDDKKWEAMHPKDPWEILLQFPAPFGRVTLERRVS